MTDLAVNQKVAASTQNEALHAILFLYKEVLRLDFEQNQIIVRDGKGMESRISMLPGSIVEELKMHLQGVKLLHLQDLEKGYGSVYLPFALEKKYPRAKYEWIWQFVFPSGSISKDPRSGEVRPVICMRVVDKKL